METAGHLVRIVVELAAGVQYGQSHLGRRLPFGGVHVGGDAATVVGHGYRTVQVNGHPDVVAVAGKGFIDGIVDDFVNQVV